MNLRTAAAVSLAAVAALGALAPASAAGKPVVTTYDATATPDPTTTTPEVGEVCDPVTPTARHRTEYKIPAAGTLKVELANTLDWAIGIRAGDTLLASADGDLPDVVEVAQVKVKKAMTVSIDACNFAGEPVVPVTVTFTPAV